MSGGGGVQDQFMDPNNSAQSNSKLQQKLVKDATTFIEKLKNQKGHLPFHSLDHNLVEQFYAHKFQNIKK